MNAPECNQPATSSLPTPKEKLEAGRALLLRLRSTIDHRWREEKLQPTCIIVYMEHFDLIHYYDTHWYELDSLPPVDAYLEPSIPIHVTRDHNLRCPLIYFDDGSATYFES